MKIGDKVRYVHPLHPSWLKDTPIATITGIGYGKTHVSVDDSPCLHPDIWVVLSDGSEERWSHRSVQPLVS